MLGQNLARSIAPALVLAVLPGCFARAEAQKIEQAKAQVRRIAEELDRNTTEAGVYIRIDEKDMQERDPWGTPIQVVYSQGGVAETVVVRSAGPDREFHTNDDIQASGMAANLKGVGEGIKQNAEETAANAARGAIKGTVEGVKDSFKRNKKSGEARVCGRSAALAVFECAELCENAGVDRRCRRLDVKAPRRTRSSASRAVDGRQRSSLIARVKEKV